MKVSTTYPPKTLGFGSRRKGELSGNWVILIFNNVVEKDLLDKTLEEFIVKDGDVFMVEVKFGDSWPRDPSS